MSITSRIVAAPDYGRTHAALREVTGPDGARRFTAEHRGAILWLDGPSHRSRRRGAAASEIVPTEGQQAVYALTWQNVGDPVPPVPDADQALADTLQEWADWNARVTYTGPYRDAVLGSVAVLGSLIHRPTSAVIAAPTTSLPEQIGGERNWDYRYAWLRDSALTVRELLRAGRFLEQVRAWRTWLVNTTDDPTTARIMYRLDGSSGLTETVLDHLPGYEGSRPVRIGNGAAGQLHLDVFGYVADTLLAAETAGARPTAPDGSVQSSRNVNPPCSSPPHPQAGNQAAISARSRARALLARSRTSGR